MPNPSMGAKIPGFDDKGNSRNWGSGGGVSGGSGTPQNIMNALNNTSTPSQDIKPIPQPNWAEPTSDNTQMASNPNYGYQPTPTGTNMGINPNAPSAPGVPISNTPSINSQGAPGFGFNSMYTTTPSNANIMASLQAGGAYG